MKKVLDNSAETILDDRHLAPRPGLPTHQQGVCKACPSKLDGWLPGTHKILRPEQWFLTA